MKNYLYLLPMLLTLMACNTKTDNPELERILKGQIAQLNRQLTNVIIADVFTPPVSARIYAYVNIAAYEAIKHKKKSPSLSAKMNGFRQMPLPKNDQHYSPVLSAHIAFTTVAKEMVYNREAIEKTERDFLKKIDAIGISKKTFEESVAFGKKTAEKVLNRARKDGYHTRTAKGGYSVGNDPGKWRPTAPDYMDAIEPYWNTLSPFVLDSVSQFDPVLPTPFDTLSTSAFYKEALQVYNNVNNLNKEKIEIAEFWDCNPNISHTRGHLKYFQQKISPGGHWIHIACQVIEDEKLSELMATQLLAKLSTTIADAFISAWNTKYKSCLVRPETYINRYIDKNWTPVLQTPAFPEYTSAHSVVSASAAVVLTDFFGDHYTFTDATEVLFGLPQRTFSSFLNAAREAAISRLYGGIHYMPAILNGTNQGIRLGTFSVKKLNNKTPSTKNMSSQIQ